MQKNALISICILNWNRREDILQSLSKIYLSTYSYFEVILVDNGSSDGTVQAVEEKYPSVIIINNQNNGIAGWNRAFEKAQGEYLLVLDNDAHPDQDALATINRIFNEHPDVDILACNILVNHDGRFLSANKFDHAHDEELIETYDFIGCGAVIRKTVIDTLGGFADFIFMYGHETEYSIRAMKQGFHIAFCPNIIVHHRVSAASRSNGMSIQYCVSNFIITSWLYFPFLYALNVSFTLLVECFALAILSSNLPSYFSGLNRIIKFVPYIVKRRNPISWELTLKIDKNFPFTIWHLSQRVVTRLTHRNE